MVLALKEKRKEIIELGGLVTIVASLLFLAFEIQQSNRIAIAATEIGIRNAYSEFNRGIHSGSDIAELLSRATESDAEWSPAEELKVLMAVTDLMNVWQAIETACVNGLAQEATCGELGDDIRAFIDMFPGIRQMWPFFLENYPSLATTEVYSTIRQSLEE